MLNRTQFLPAGLCALLAVSLIALPGCGGRSKKKEAKVDTAPVVTAKGSEEVAAEKASADAGPAVQADAAPTAEPAPEAASPDMGGSTRGRAFEEASAPAPMSEP